MIKLRDPHDDAKLAMRELNDDIVAQPDHSLRALAGIHLQHYGSPAVRRGYSGPGRVY